MTIRTKHLALPAAAIAALVAGCGGGSDKPAPAASKPAAVTTTAQAPAPSGDQAVKDAVLNWTFKGGCDFMTDKFIEQQAFIGDNRTERCAYLKKTFHKPQYSPTDLKFRSVKVAGAKATVVVGSDIASIETTYTLLSSGGQWRIDEAG